MARPSKIDKDEYERLANQGYSQTAIACCLGVCLATLNTWHKKTYGKTHKEMGKREDFTYGTTKA